MEQGGYFLKFNSQFAARRARDVAAGVADWRLSRLNPPESWQGRSNWSRLLNVGNESLYVTSDARLWNGEYRKWDAENGGCLFQEICINIAMRDLERRFEGMAVCQDTVTGHEHAIRTTYDIKTLIFLVYWSDEPALCEPCRRRFEADTARDEMGCLRPLALEQNALRWCQLATCEPSAACTDAGCNVHAFEQVWHWQGDEPWTRYLAIARVNGAVVK